MSNRNASKRRVQEPTTCRLRDRPRLPDSRPGTRCSNSGLPHNATVGTGVIKRHRVLGIASRAGDRGTDPPSVECPGTTVVQHRVDVMTHWGELAQGGVLLDEKDRINQRKQGREVTVLVTLPDPMFSAHAIATVKTTRRHGVRMKVLPRVKAKANQAAQHVGKRFGESMLEEFGALGLEIRIVVENNVPNGVKGAGSSSADTYAAIRVLNELFKLGLTDEEVFREMCLVEPSDPLPLLGVGKTPLAASRVGQIISYLPNLPEILVVAFALFEERSTDTETQATNTTYTDEERHAFGEILKKLERALLHRAARDFCECAQHSLELNQARRRTPQLEKLLRAAQRHRAFLAGSHSGEASAFLLPLADETANAHGQELKRVVAELGAKHIHVFKLPCGGHPCRMKMSHG